MGLHPPHHTMYVNSHASANEQADIAHYKTSPSVLSSSIPHLVGAGIPYQPGFGQKEVLPEMGDRPVAYQVRAMNETGCEFSRLSD